MAALSVSPLSHGMQTSTVVSQKPLLDETSIIVEKPEPPRRKYWPSNRALDWMGVWLLHCIFAVALAAVMHSLIGYFLDGSSDSSLAGSCDGPSGYTASGVFQDLRQIASFALGATTCALFTGDVTGDTEDTHDDEDDGGLLRLNFQLVNFL